MIVVATFVVAAAVTYGLRSTVTLVGRPVPERLDEIAGLITPAILSAMVSSGLLLDGPERRPVAPSPAVVVAVVCMVAVVGTRRSIATGLAVAFPAFWIGTLVGLG